MSQPVCPNCATQDEVVSTRRILLEYSGPTVSQGGGLILHSDGSSPTPYFNTTYFQGDTDLEFLQARINSWINEPKVVGFDNRKYSNTRLVIHASIGMVLFMLIAGGTFLLGGGAIGIAAFIPYVAWLASWNFRAKRAASKVASPQALAESKNRETSGWFCARCDRLFLSI